MAHSGEAVLRLPDFVVIGTMKSGTTTLFRWLDQHPDVRMPSSKEPDFFSDDRRYRSGIEAYARLFARFGPDISTGEASVRYTDPRFARSAASRLRTSIPDAKLLCLLRDPVERLRSHYLHEVQRGRERRLFAEAIEDPDGSYIRRSCYADALAPWCEEFPKDQLRLVCFEELTSLSETAWDDVLEFLRLRPMPRPAGRFNVTQQKLPFSPLMRVLYDTKLAQRLPRPPRALRPIARRVLFKRPEDLSTLSGSTNSPLPAWADDVLRDQVVGLKALVPDFEPTWGLA